MTINQHFGWPARELALPLRCTCMVASPFARSRPLSSSSLLVSGGLSSLLAIFFTTAWTCACFPFKPSICCTVPAANTEHESAEVTQTPTNKTVISFFGPHKYATISGYIGAAGAVGDTGTGK